MCCLGRTAKAAAGVMFGKNSHSGCRRVVWEEQSKWLLMCCLKRTVKVVADVLFEKNSQSGC